MSSHVTSADGTRIAYDTLGDGPALILIAGIFCTRKTLQPLAEQLAGRFPSATTTAAAVARAPIHSRTQSSARSRTLPR